MLETTFHIEGRSPLIMHADTTVNPLNRLTKEIKKLTAKKTKTDSDHERIARLEFEAGLYFDDDIGPFMPGQNIEKMLNEAAKKTKKGKDVIEGLMCLDDKAPLIYKGPRTIDKLFGDGNTEFVDQRSVRIGRSRIMRCRPIFLYWELKFTVAIDEKILNVEDVRQYVETAGYRIGLSNYRPRFGRFNVLA